MTSEKGCRKDKNQNIQVFVRLRPLNQRERDIKSLGVVEVLGNREVIVRHSPQTSHTKKFTFDHAFGPNAKQVEVYQAVVSPLIEEVLAGYNCTVFAYGQTGTGKTHTMVGENTSEDTSWQNDPLAGIIPRALSQLFDELRISNTEYTVRVSYLELYNEELFDLLSSSEDNSKLRIYEDVTRKGSNIVNGLEEITVYNKNEVYKIMSQGQERKRVASTLMNAQSSRSHTVFTIVVHMKENSPEGEELVKIGKLNLVDLAGSENISKAGSDNPGKKERARECVNINQSLLTLGRVITALVERHPHIPYRESKLTRILQESLGGRTKTSIIATVSPGHKDLEETMSTLEYANRAKNIQNKPEINQKMTKKAILKEYAEEIDRLKRDLQAARDKNGIYLAEETFTDMKYKQEEQRKEIQELLLKVKMMEEKRDTMETVFSELNKTLEVKATELQTTRAKLSTSRTQLANTHNMLRSTKQQYEEQAHLVEKLKATEEALSSQAKELVATADLATSHTECLHDSMDRRRKVESTNLELTRSYREQSSEQRAAMMACATDFTRALGDELRKIHAELENVTTAHTSSLEDIKNTLEKLVSNISHSMDEIKCLTSASESGLMAATDAHRTTVHSSVENHSTQVHAALAALVRSVADTVLAAEAGHLPDVVANFVNQWYSSAVNRARSMVTSHGAFAARVCESERARGDVSRSHYDERRAAIQWKAENIQNVVAELEAEKAEMQARLARQERDIETERQDTETRLRQWVEEERRLLEERIQARLASETAVMEFRLAKKTEELETDRKLFENRIARRLQSQQTILDACAQDLVKLDAESREEHDGRAKAENIVHAYSKEFNEEAAAIGIDMEAFSQNVVEVVKHKHGELVTTLHHAREQLEKDARSVEAADAAAGAQLENDTAAVHAQLLHQHRDNIANLLSTVENTNASTASELSSLASSADTLVSSARHHAAQHAASVQDVTSHAAQYARRSRDLVETHEHLERRYVSEEYKVYSPTGSTPQRTQYRYPRSLVATSPHDRILARFRSRMRNNEDECIVIEDVESPAASEGESSLSDDSVSFVIPSTPAPAAPAAPSRHKGGIVKCTSESDLYDIKRNEEQQGKENVDRDLNGHKKPSKLRAPTSHKKPLYERNDNN